MITITDIFEKFGITASDAQAKDFEKWVINFAWSKYNDDKMNQRVIIENKVKSLGLRFPNGTVGKEYSTQFIIPNELVDDVWIEGVEELGLRASLKDVESKENALIKESPTSADGDVNVKIVMLMRRWRTLMNV